MAQVGAFESDSVVLRLEVWFGWCGMVGVVGWSTVPLGPLASGTVQFTFGGRTGDIDGLINFLLKG